MSHEELLEKIRVFLVATELQSIDEDFEGTKMLKALRAVVELHIPETKTLSDGDVIVCHSCGAKATDTSMKDRIYYPCPTIQAIEKELQ